MRIRVLVNVGHRVSQYYDPLLIRWFVTTAGQIMWLEMLLSGDYYDMISKSILHCYGLNLSRMLMV